MRLLLLLRGGRVCTTGGGGGGLVRGDDCDVVVGFGLFLALVLALLAAAAATFTATPAVRRSGSAASSKSRNRDRRRRRRRRRRRNSLTLTILLRRPCTGRSTFVSSSSSAADARGGEMRGRVGQQSEQDGVDGNVAVLPAAAGGVGGGGDLSSRLLVMWWRGRSGRTLLILLLLLRDESGEGGMELRDGEVRVVVADDRRLVQVRALSLGKLGLLRVVARTGISATQAGSKSVGAASRLWEQEGD